MGKKRKPRAEPCGAGGAHHWVIATEAVEGAYAARCKRCAKERSFRPFDAEAQFLDQFRKPPPGKGGKPHGPPVQILGRNQPWP